MTERKVVGKKQIEVELYELEGVGWIRQDTNHNALYGGYGSSYDYYEPDWYDRCSMGVGELHSEGYEVYVEQEGVYKVEYNGLKFSDGIIKFNKPTTVRYYIERKDGRNIIYIEIVRDENE